MPSNNTPDLIELEQILHLPLMDFPASFFCFGSRRLIEAMDRLPPTKSIGVLLRVDSHQNTFRKVYSLMLASIRVRLIERRLPCRCGSIFGNYGVYPELDAPVVIYALGTRAEEYINEHILPSYPDGLKGRLRRIIMKAIGFHPSVCGIIVVMSKA